MDRVYIFVLAREVVARNSGLALSFLMLRVCLFRSGSFSLLGSRVVLYQPFLLLPAHKKYLFTKARLIFFP